MKYLILLLIFFSSCKNNIENQRIEKFEIHLGQKNVYVLDETVKYLDSLVNSQNKINNTNYNLYSYLDELCQKNENWDSFYKNQSIKNIKNLSKEMGFHYELYLKYDTAYAIEEEIISSYSYLYRNDTLPDFFMEPILEPFDYELDSIEIFKLLENKKNEKKFIYLISF